jgi:hypothetical protein
MIAIGNTVVTYTGIVGIVEKVYYKDGKEYCVIRTEDNKTHRYRTTNLLMGGN